MFLPLTDDTLKLLLRQMTEAVVSKHEAEVRRFSLQLSSEVCLESFLVSPGVQGLQPKAIKCKAGGHHSEITCALLAGDQGMCISRHSSGFSKPY